MMTGWAVRDRRERSSWIVIIAVSDHRGGGGEGVRIGSSSGRLLQMGMEMCRMRCGADVLVFFSRASAPASVCVRHVD